MLSQFFSQKLFFITSQVSIRCTPLPSYPNSPHCYMPSGLYAHSPKIEECRFGDTYMTVSRGGICLWWPKSYLPFSTFTSSYPSQLAGSYHSEAIQSLDQLILSPSASASFPDTIAISDRYSTNRLFHPLSSVQLPKQITKPVNLAGMWLTETCEHSGLFSSDDWCRRLARFLYTAP